LTFSAENAKFAFGDCGRGNEKNAANKSTVGGKDEAGSKNRPRMERFNSTSKGKPMMLGIRRQGFTLIELLIVVAIIAILALIAVPNFLEAQTRAKASRAKSDMRTLTTAEEAYYVDWNSYTFRDLGDYRPVATYVEGFRQLTSPIAYITTIPQDAFGGYRDSPGWMHPLFELGAGSATTLAPTGPLNNPNPEGMPSDTFMFRSTGPDRYDDTNVGNYPISWRSDNLADVSGRIYDPTNGTVSSGDIYRAGGMKPAHPSFDILFNASSK